VEKQPQGLKPSLTLGIRGPEGPLFHGSSKIGVSQRNCTPVVIGSQWHG
jgi:hypothetical protein